MAIGYPAKPGTPPSKGIRSTGPRQNPPPPKSKPRT